MREKTEEMKKRRDQRMERERKKRKKRRRAGHYTTFHVLVQMSSLDGDRAEGQTRVDNCEGTLRQGGVGSKDSCETWGDLR